MNKVITLVLALSMIMMLTACDKDKENTLMAESTGATANTLESTNTSTGGAQDNKQDITDSAVNDPSLETTVPSNDNIDISNPSHTHEYVIERIVATCTQTGFTIHMCICGDSFIDGKTNATGHSFGEWYTIKEPTVNSTGLAERQCSACDTKETKVLGQLIDNHEHSYTVSMTTPPSCILEGTMTYSCSCGDTYNEPIPSVDHQYSYRVTDPTCTNEGYTIFTCTVCGNSYRDNFTHPTEHNWKAAPCTVEKTCLTCGETEGIVYGHVWKDATCTLPSICEECGETKGVPLGHNWRVATCTAAKVCKVCKVTEGSANGHSWVDGNCTTPKTCSVCNTMDGEAVHNFIGDRCSLCGCKEPSVGLIFYKYKDGYYLLTAGTCADAEIVIPTTYKGLPVVGIYKDFSTRNNNSNATIKSDSITSIFIPSSITAIEARVFLNCSSLTSIVYDGTIQQWNAISKGDHWNSAFSTIVVTCNDGTLTYKKI